MLDHFGGDRRNGLTRAKIDPLQPEGDVDQTDHSGEGLSVVDPEDCQSQGDGQLNVVAFVIEGNRGNLLEIGAFHLTHGKADKDITC